MHDLSLSSPVQATSVAGCLGLEWMGAEEQNKISVVSGWLVGLCAWTELTQRSLSPSLTVVCDVCGYIISYPSVAVVDGG